MEPGLSSLPCSRAIAWPTPDAIVSRIPQLLQCFVHRAARHLEEARRGACRLARTQQRLEFASQADRLGQRLFRLGGAARHHHHEFAPALVGIGPDSLAQFGQRPAQHGFKLLRHFTADRRTPLRAETHGQVAKTLRDSVARFEKHQRARLGPQSLQELAASRTPGGQKTFERKAVGGQSTDRQRRGDGTRAGDGHDVDTLGRRKSDQPITGIGQQRGARIGNQCDGLAALQAAKQMWRLLLLIVFVQGQQLPVQPVAGQQRAAVPRVLGRDNIHFCQYTECPQRDVLEIADRRRHHVEAAVCAVVCHSGDIMNQAESACGIISGSAMSRVSMPGHIPQSVRIAAALLTVLITACSTTAWDVEPPAETATVAQASAAFARGDYAAAAAAWESEALLAPPDRAAALRVSAADAWLLAGDVAGAEHALRGVSKAGLQPADQSRLDLVLADLALRAARPDEADVLLQQAADALPASSRDRYNTLQVQTRKMLSGPASMALARATQITGDMQSYNPGAAVELMRALEDVSSGELSIRSENPRADRQWIGWLDLALVIRQNLVIPDGISAAVAAWKIRHPYHLLAETEALDTWLRYRQLFSPPRRTAALLPDTASLRSAGDAIRDGLLSAYLDQPGGGSLLFFSTNDDSQSTIAAYFSALDAGADQIVGPLRRESVEELLNLPGLATPVLALNDPPESFAPPQGLDGQLFGISLSQEAEVAAVAANAVAFGYQRAIVLAPESAWGERMAAAFQAEFLHDERQIIAATRYLETDNDHSATLERLLLIDESKARAQRLENVLQMPLEFEPTRRDDVDVIFMAANPTQAKLIRPQLRFLDAGDVPVYATGRVYSGQPDPARNQDLDGVRFPTTPWELAHASEDRVPDLASLRKGSLGSLFALGQDVWNMLSWLGLMRRDHDFVFPGHSGTYRVNTAGRLEREPAWAVFEQGRPVPLTMPPPNERQAALGPGATGPASVAPPVPELR